MNNIKKFRIKSFKNDNTILNLEKISLKFGKKIILDNLNLKLNNGEVLGLLGPNGAGKSTIFNIITGLIHPDYGLIKINSLKVNNYPTYLRAKKFKISFVPQHGGFFHDLSVYENLKAIGEIVIDNPNFIEEKINLLISQFNLESLKSVKADLLSGGQKKKLVIALSLLSDPKILLLDEPFAALDIMTIGMLQKIIVDLQNVYKLSIILCDHQARDLLACVDRAAIINNGQVITEGTPSALMNNLDAKNVYFGNNFNFK